ncbi:failed axon connections homolog isoform X1 [Ruditapes philippinarum]|uniref:failed axon connections homolog isoform X1 n=1 Tax=Ruditapes philippinarum TaxID=129788 RepID=UPI00295B937A|nr:failed axon connections homolog isoform X1 [Ruditapes philippinarum]
MRRGLSERQGHSSCVSSDQNYSEYGPLCDEVRNGISICGYIKYRSRLNVYSRWVIFGDEMLRKFLKVPGPVAALLKITMRPGIIKTSYTVGIGRHSDEEVHQLMRNDLKKFSDLLGDKKYIMGDKITETDCAAFGILSQIRWCTPESCPGRQLLTSLYILS